jgi:hypothetical protein
MSVSEGQYRNAIRFLLTVIGKLLASNVEAALGMDSTDAIGMKGVKQLMEDGNDADQG